MKTNFIRLIVVFSALALVGLIATQAFWIKKAIVMGQKHFEHRANVALHSAVEEMKRIGDAKKGNCMYAQREDTDVLMVVDPHLLDSLIHKYTRFYKLYNEYEFAIVNSHNDTIIYKTKGFYRNCPSEKVFKHCLSCVFQKRSCHIELIFPESMKNLMTGIWNWLILSGIFLVIIIFCFGFIVFAAFRHKKISEMKTDFINNMTHEFKTPISTISLSTEVLLNTNRDTSIDKIHKYAKIIQEENQRMQSQVEQVLRMAQLDRGGYDLNLEDTDVHELIQNAVHNLCLDQLVKEVKIVYNLQAKKFVVKVDQIHLTNIVKNLVENAYKYTRTDSQIILSTSSNTDGITISVADNGIGISGEKQKYIFDKFYRVPTGAVHDVKGFGIGLYYVRVMIEAHGGKVSVKSEQDKGSRFDVFLPF